MKELFQSRKKEEEEENQILAFYKKFMNQGPPYFGDLDEEDGALLEFEKEIEEEGACYLYPSSYQVVTIYRLARDISQLTRSTGAT